MGSIKQLLEIIALFVVTGMPLLVMCLCHMAKSAEDFNRWYQRRCSCLLIGQPISCAKVDSGGCGLCFAQAKEQRERGVNASAFVGGEEIQQQSS
jgi:hypothetical protein